MNDLFDPPAHQRHSRTSYEAAEAIKPSASSLRGKVFAYLKGRGGDGATDLEMQIALRMNGNTQRPRRVELVALGLVVDSGTRRKLTPKHRSATVWRAAT